jgi:Tautomerase enzyme
MPVAKIYVPEGTLTQDQRREIVKGIHDVINRVEGRPGDGLLTYVLIKGHFRGAPRRYQAAAGPDQEALGAGL